MDGSAQKYMHGRYSCEVKEIRHLVRLMPSSPSWYTLVGMKSNVTHAVLEIR
jgi:hypothetical protein